MQKSPFSRTIWFASLLMLAGGALFAKVPVTTASPQALEFYMKGQELADKLRAPEARNYFEQAIAADAKFAMAYYSMALASPTAKSFYDNITLAAGLVDKVSEGEKLYILASHAALNGKASEQQNCLEKLVTAFPDDERALNTLGVFYYGQQKFDKSVATIEKAVAANPNFSPAYNMLGYANRDLGNYEQAEKAFVKYIEMIPDDPNPYDSYAELLLKMGRYDESIVQYQKALEKKPNFTPSYVGIATNLNYKGDHAGARVNALKLYEMAKDDGQRRTANNAMAISYVFESQMAKAIAELKKNFALAEAAKDVLAMSGDYTSIGDILLDSGQVDAAFEEYKKGLDVLLKADVSSDVKNVGKLTFLYQEAVVAAKKGEMNRANQKAEELLTGANQLKNWFWIQQAHEAMGIAALEAKNYKKAVEELQQTSQADPYNLFRLALAYDGLGDKTLAKSWCEKAKNFNALNSINQAFIHNRAVSFLAAM